MGIFGKLCGRKNSIEKMDINDLRGMEIRLNHKIDGIQGVIQSLDNRITNLFEDAKKTMAANEEISIARRIKTTSQEKEMKLTALAQLEKELRVVSNLLILKEHERDLRTAGIWDKVLRIDPDNLESWLINKKITANDRDDLISTVIEMTSCAMETRIEEEDLGDILDTIHAIKSEAPVPIHEKTREVHKIQIKETDKE